MEAERRRILDAVREGSMTPEEALRVFDGMGEQDRGEPEEPDRDAVRGEVALLRIEHELGTVKVRGDPSVARFSVSGPHSVQEQGSTVLIKGDASFVGVGFVMGPGERRPRWRWPGKDQRHHSFLDVSVNPSIPLEVHVDAGRLHVTGIRAPVKAHVDLGTVLIKDFHGPIDLKVDSGTVSADGLVTGRSSIACELGKVVARLDPASDVRIDARCTLGSVSLGDAEGTQKRSGVGSTGGFELGNGSGELDIRVEAGSIKVAVGK